VADTATITPPWTEQQVATLNAFQRSGIAHPFTCGAQHHGSHRTLIATERGWECPDDECTYEQRWAHAFMADPRTLTTGIGRWAATRRAAGPRLCHHPRAARQNLQLPVWHKRRRGRAWTVRRGPHQEAVRDTCPDCGAWVIQAHQPGWNVGPLLTPTLVYS
jgi:hypothetical protein